MSPDPYGSTSLPENEEIPIESGTERAPWILLP